MNSQAGLTRHLNGLASGGALFESLWSRDCLHTSSGGTSARGIWRGMGLAHLHVLMLARAIIGTTEVDACERGQGGRSLRHQCHQRCL